MKVLLDTHVLWWTVSTPSRLSRDARAVIHDRRTELVCSAVAPWELAMKHRLGRLPEAAPFLDTFPEQLERLGARELSMTSRHALLAGRIEWDHRDPFDRMLAAQSILEGLPLITADRAFSTLPGLHVVW